MNNFILSQVLILLASVSDFFGFQIKKREHTLLLFTISALLISAHYFLLGASVAGFTILVSALRFFSGIFTTRKTFMYLFLVLALGLGVYSYKNLWDILPIAAGALGTTAAFHASPRTLRIIMMVATCLYITYNIIIWSPAAIIVESIFLISNIVSYFRFFRKTSL